MNNEKLNDDTADKNEVFGDQIKFPGGIIKVKIRASVDEYFPYYSGNILRASFLNFVTNIDKDLAGILHKDNEVRSYSMSQIRVDGREQNRTKRKELIVKEGDILTFKIGVLDDEILERLIKLLIKDSNHKFQIFNREYELLSMEYSKICYTKSELSDKVKIYFQSPTYFTIKAKPEPMLFPDPKYFFMNILNIWNSINKDTLICEKTIFEWIEKNVVINDYATYTRRIYLSKNRTINGFMGWVVYRFKNKDKIIPWIDLLLEYTKLSNVGGNRTAGMGEIEYRWLEEKKIENIKRKKLT